MARRRQPGEGAVFQLADGRWRAQLDLGTVDGKRLRPTATRQTMREARDALAQMREKYGAVEPGQDQTLNDWLDYWLEVIAPARVRPATIPGYKSKLDLYIRKPLGRKKLSTLKPEDFERIYARMRSEGLSEATIRQTHAIVRRALTVAEKRRMIPRNPCAVIELPHGDPKPRDRWTAAESKDVLARVEPGREWLRVACGLMAGMRPGEVLALRWDDVHEDVTSPYIAVTGGLRPIPSKGLVVTAPKSARSERIIPIWESMVAPFRAWRAESGGSGFVFGVDRGSKPKQPRRDALEWDAMCARIGVRRISPGGARPSGAVLMAAAGVPLVTLQAILGHADASTTARHYAIADDEMTRAGIRQAETWFNAMGQAGIEPAAELPAAD